MAPPRDFFYGTFAECLKIQKQGKASRGLSSNKGFIHSFFLQGVFINMVHSLLKNKKHETHQGVFEPHVSFCRDRRHIILRYIVKEKNMHDLALYFDISNRQSAKLCIFFSLTIQRRMMCLQSRQKDTCGPKTPYCHIAYDVFLIISL